MEINKNALYIIEKLNKTLINIWLSMLIGLIICYIFGTIGFMLYLGCDLWTAIITAILPFIVFDILK